MRGLDRLQQIRRQGMRPDGIVSLWAPGTGGRYAYEGTVMCDAQDRPELTDLRSFKGLTVHVIAKGFGRFDEGETWARAVIAAGADSVLLSVELPPEQGYFEGPAWLRFKGENLA